MDSLHDELKVEIFKYVDTPLSLLLINRKWYKISQDPYTRANWVIYKYGKAHVLFHTVRLGNNFISINVIQSLLRKGAIISRYFIQRLTLQFGTSDPQLIQMKTKYNGNYNGNSSQVQKKPWASDLPLQIFTHLLTEASNVLGKDVRDLALKGNDMELFHLLTAGPVAINFVPPILYKNLECIKDLILNKKFIPFPPRPKPIIISTLVPSAPSGPPVHSMSSAPSPSAPSAHFIPSYFASPTLNYQDYQDGYEANHRLNLVARAIIICPDLIKIWKELGYNEICIHYNNLVLSGILLILFPPVKPVNWICPEPCEVVSRLKQFIDLGFQLTDSVIRESIKLFSNKYHEIQILLNSFYIIRGESLVKTIIDSCINPAIIAVINNEKKKGNLI